MSARLNVALVALAQLLAAASDPRPVLAADAPAPLALHAVPIPSSPTACWP